MRISCFALGGLLSLAFTACTTRQAAPGAYRVYIGTYTAGTESKGIYRFDLDTATGQTTAPVLAAATANPSFLAVHPAGTFLYATGETSDFQGKPTGAVHAFAINRDTGDLTPLNSQPSRGAGPCHLVVDPSGRNLLVANYGAGSAACLPITGDGRLSAATGFIQHEGSSVNKQRQEGPHAHSINVGPDKKTVFVADLGTDRVMIYQLDPKAGTLTPNDPPFAAVAPGGGPRHFAFHPSGKFAYTNNEMTSSVTAFAWDAKHRSLKEIETRSTLPEGYAEPGNSTAEVVVHPSGHWLYVSNRGHDSLALFAISESGSLAPRGHISTGGKVPRNFAIDPTGNWLIAANQESNNLVVFRVDKSSGLLTPVGEPLSVPKPVCVRFLAVDR